MESQTLLESLTYAPRELQFGTSGRRGEVLHLTQLEIYINAFAELEFLQSLAPADGGVRAGEEFYYAYDLRPSSTRFVPDFGGRGEIAQAIEAAVRDSGLRPVNLGSLPTPALAYWSLQQGKGCMMITGSHIPFDRNGYKTYTAKGELLKKHEAAITSRVHSVRERLYRQPARNSDFGPDGQFRSGSRSLAPEMGQAREAYIRRYVDFFGAGHLEEFCVLVYEHSAVGRDILREVLEQLGVTVFPAGRSDSFVPIDTENIDAQEFQKIQGLVDAVSTSGICLDGVVSADGDSDRPLLLGFDCKPGDARQLHFISGDLLGMVVAEYLGADGVVVPISCNDALYRGALKSCVEPRTRIGSPYVIEGIEKARYRGKRRVCGWEANGGFLLGSDIELKGRRLSALVTRDALLPILCALAAAKERGLLLSGLFKRLPARFSRAALIKNFPRECGHRIVNAFAPPSAEILEVEFFPTGLRCRDEEGREVALGNPASLMDSRRRLSSYFSPDLGFGDIVRLNFLDGMRIWFSNGDIAHVRPSGNADELRMYAVADTQVRADQIAAAGVAQPAGILRRLEREVAG